VVVADRWRGLADLCTKTVRGAIGLTATYTPAATGIPQSIKAPFSEAYFELILEDAQASDTMRETNFDVRLEDLSAAPALGDTIEISRIGEAAAVTLVVQDIRRGGQGTAKLVLSAETA
jgi:hypothetical protein